MKDFDEEKIPYLHQPTRIHIPQGKKMMGSIKATHLLRWLLNKLQRWWKMSLLKRLKQPLKRKL
jgi:hypothetical protein